jgi:hypothetical protein
MAASYQAKGAIIMITRIAAILDDLRLASDAKRPLSGRSSFIIGWFIRCDHPGIASIVRWLFILP